MEWNLSKTDQQMIAARTNFKYEDTYTLLWQAIDGAAVRSAKSIATIYIHRTTTGYTVNAHGVLRMHETCIMHFKSGVCI